METRDRGFPGEFGRNSTGHEEEQRFGEEAHAYNRGSTGPIRDDERGRGEAWLAEESDTGRGLLAEDTLIDGERRIERQERQGGMATSSAMVGTGTTSGLDSAHGSPVEGTQHGGGIGSADHGSVGTVNSGSGAGLSSGNATGGLTGAGVSDDAAWQRDRSGFQEHFVARHPAQGEATTRRTWEQAEPNYRYGYEAARSERYQGRAFEEIEPDLRREYEREAWASGRDQERSWERLREEVREGFRRFRAR